MDAGLIRQGLVLLIKGGVFLARNRVIWVTFSSGKFIHDARLWMLLPGEVLKFGDTREIVVIGIVHHGDRLILRSVHSLMFKFQAAIGKFSEFEIKEFVDGPGVDHFRIGQGIFHVAVVGI